MHNTKGLLAIIVSLGLALALLLPLSIIGASVPVVGIAAPAEVDPGSSFVANVTVDYVADFDSCGFDVTYDKTVIHVTDVTGGVIAGQTITVGAGDWTYIPAGSVDTGKIRVTAVKSGAPACGLNGAGYLAQIHFTVVSSGGDSSNINPSNVGMYDCRAAAIGTATQGTSVDVSGTKPVGGTAYPPNKLLMVLPWIILGAAIIAGATVLVRRHRSAVR